MSRPFATLTVALVAAVFALPLSAAEKRNEDFYNRAWCLEHGGRPEVGMPSGARADCLVGEYAVEADWSNKWAEAIGQSLHYASETGRKPAILFLVHEKSKPAELYRLESTIQAHGLDIAVFVIDAPKRK